MEFEDLPKYQQDLVRGKLIQTGPIGIDCNEYGVRYLRPKLDAIPSAIRDVARKAFYEQNTFHVSNTRGWYNTQVENDVAKLIRKIGFFGDLDWIARNLPKFKQLEELEIGVDEAHLVESEARPADGYQPQVLRLQDIPYGLNLIVLRNRAVQKLRQLRVPKVRFTHMFHVGSSSSDLDKKRTTGPIPGGVLETIVAREMMGSTKSTADPPLLPAKRKACDTIFVARKNGVVTERNQAYMRRMMKWTKIQAAEVSPPPEPAPESSIENPVPVLSTFRFLDLPPELRNKVYSYILSHPGPINPSTRTPISSYVDGNSPTDLDQVIHPSLALLQANKQIFDEAVGMFYFTNKFVFFYPLQCMMFLETIGLKRRSFITDITLWYKSAYKQGNMSFFDLAVLQLRNLAGLEKLRIILDEPTALAIDRGAEIPGDRHIKGMSEAGVKVTFRCPEGDAILWYNFDDEGKRITTGSPYRRAEIDVARRMVEGAKVAESQVAKKQVEAGESTKVEKPV